MKRKKSFFSRFFVDRKLIISSDNKVISWNFKAELQIAIFCTLLVISMIISGICFFTYMREKRLTMIYDEMTSLQNINQNLHSYIEGLNHEFKELARYFGFSGSDKHKKNQHASSAANPSTYAEDAIKTTNNVLAFLINGINTRLSKIVRTIEQTGLQPQDFLGHAKELQRVKLSYSQDITENSLQFYNDNKHNYVVKSQVLEGIYQANDKSTMSNIAWGVKMAVDLEKLVASMPVHSPMKDFVISSKYGPRYDPVLKQLDVHQHSMHKGIDLHGSPNAPIFSAGSGKVMFVGYSKSYGNVVDINHGYGVMTRYAHMATISNNLKPGMQIPAGVQIGTQGATGARCTGPHLHYEVRKNGATMNPAHFIYASHNVEKTFARK